LILILILILRVVCSLHRRTAMMCGFIFGMKFVLSMILMVTPPCFGAKILFIPANVQSHVLYFSRLAADLSQLGHVTHVFAPSNARVPQFIAELEHGGNFSYTRYPVDGEQPFANFRNVSELIIRVAISRSPWEKFVLSYEMFKGMLHHTESECIRLLENDHVMQQIRSDGYQFAVMDPIVPQCYYAIPYSMGITYASMSLPGLAWTYRVPRLPSFSPLLLGFGYTDRMSFGQRLTTFVVGNLLLQHMLEFFMTTKYVDRLAPDQPSLNGNQLLLQVYSSSRFL